MYDPQQQASYLLQGSAPTLQSSNYSGLQVQPAYTGSLQLLQPTVAPSLNQTLTGSTSPYNESTASTGEQYYEDPSVTAARQAAQQQAAADAAADSAYRTQLEGQLGRLDQQQDIGLGNIGNSFNQSLNRLDEQKGVAKRNYDIGVEDTTRGYQTTRNNIATQTRNRMNALQRLLGIAGSGNSSAAYDAAPFAALREGSVNLGGAQQSYATNRRNQDLGWQDTERSYETNMGDLNQDRFSKEQGLKASIAQTRASVLDRLGSIGNNRDQYSGQINSLLDQITQLGNQYASPVLRQGNVAYQAPSLQQYNLNARQPNVQLAPQQTAVADSVNPALLPLLARERDEYGNLIG